MLKNLFVFILCFASFINIEAADNATIFRIDDTEVKVSEFEYIYNKNNFDNKADYSESSIREYLELYINFRLKVKEAEALGLDKDNKLQRELKVYQAQLYNSFYDKNVLKVLIQEAEERYKEDVSISHIFISANPLVANTKNTEAKKTIQAAYESLKNGNSFNDVAKKYSEDKYSSDKGGYIGFFTALQIAFYSFENAAYNTVVGSYSKPIETAIGYHIIQVNEKRPARGQVKTAIIKLNKTKDQAKNAIAATKINTIYEQLKGGADFATLARTSSEDSNTKANGGELDWFGIAQYDPIFEDNAFSLENNGDYTKPFETENAWYITKLIDKKQLGQNKDALTKNVKKSDRYFIQRKEHIDSILKKHGYKLNQTTFDNFKLLALKQFDSNQYKFIIAQPSILMEFANTKITDQDFGDFIFNNKSKYRKLSKDEKFSKLFDDFLEEETIDFHIIEYGNEDEEYGALLNEYRDGILLFDLMEKKVWSKAVEDSVGLKNYYLDNKSNFKTKEKATVNKFSVPNSKAANLLNKILKVDPKLQNNKNLIKLEKKGVYSVPKKISVEKTDALSKQFDWETNSCKIATEGGKQVIYQVVQIFPETERSFEDSKGFAIAGYQEYLEKEWLKELHQKYKVEIDETVLKGLIK